MTDSNVVDSGIIWIEWVLQMLQMLQIWNDLGKHTIMIKGLNNKII